MLFPPEQLAIQLGRELPGIGRQLGPFERILGPLSVGLEPQERRGPLGLRLGFGIGVRTCAGVARLRGRSPGLGGSGEVDHHFLGVCRQARGSGRRGGWGSASRGGSLLLLVLLLQELVEPEQGGGQALPSATDVSEEPVTLPHQPGQRALGLGPGPFQGGVRLRPEFPSLLVSLAADPVGSVLGFGGAPLGLALRF